MPRVSKMGGTRTQVCLHCGKEFTYKIASGTDRKICSKKCVNARNKILAAQRGAKQPSCSVEGCSGKAVRIQAGLCEKHHARKRRGAPLFGDKVPNYRYKKGNYYLIYRPDHPLADSGGNIYEHRYVAYLDRNGVCEPCFWCAKPLEWADAVVDHLNEDKADNSPKNLVLACNKCNRARGAMLNFIAGLSDASMEFFIFNAIDYNHRMRKGK